MESSPRTIAIAGATGFVGRHVVPRLLEEPDLVLRCLVRPSSDTAELEALASELAEAADAVTRLDAGTLE